MIFKEYGDKNNKTIILLHGGGLSWWNYKEEAEKLQNSFHVILPILDGHSESDRKFTTIEDNAKEIIEYINENLNGHVYLIGGLSLGGQILLEILSQKTDICDYAIVESALIIPMKITSKMIKPAYYTCYNLVSKKWFSKLQFNSLKIKKDLFDDYYRDTCKITREDMIAFIEASLRYEIKESTKQTGAKILIIVGDKEQSSMKKSAEMLHQEIKNSILRVIPDYYHGDLSINHPEEYIGIIDELINNK